MITISQEQLGALRARLATASVEFDAVAAELRTDAEGIISASAGAWVESFQAAFDQLDVDIRAAVAKIEAKAEQVARGESIADQADADAKAAFLSG